MTEPDIIHLIKTKSSAIRTQSDLDYIRNYLDANLSSADAIWKTLTPNQKNSLCKHFEFKGAFCDGHYYPCIETRGGYTHDPLGLFVLLHGEAEVCTGEHLIVLNSGYGEEAVRVVLGRLGVPKDAVDFFCLEGGGSIYRRFVSLEKRVCDVSVHFKKGSKYLFLPASKSSIFLNRLNANLLTRRILQDIGMSSLLQRNPPSSRPQIFHFSPGNILIREGSVANRVLFIATGSCFIFRNSSKRGVAPICVGSLESPSFIGFSPLLCDHQLHATLYDKDTDDEAFGIHSVSVVAVQEGYAFSFSSQIFLSVIKNSESTAVDLVSEFKMLADCEKVWMNATDEEEDGDESENETTEVLETIIEENHATVKANDNAIKLDVVERDIEKNADESEVKIDDLISNIGNGKLKRSKLLTALHESFASEDNSHETNLVDCDHPLLQSISKKLLKDIMANLERDCGVTFRCEETDDPWHNFTIQSDDPEEQMSLVMPISVLRGLENMSHNFLGLGRKRPPKYDDGDPFLLPVPSTVDRKMHGKTLPIIRRSKGSIDPVNLNEKEWL